MKYKDDVIAARFTDMNPLAQRIALEMDTWTRSNYGIELTITATTSDSSEDLKLQRVSDTHRTRRAWDIRTHDLPDNVIAELIAYTNKKFGKFGAIASVKPVLIVYKPHGSGPHLHCQLSRKYALPEIKYA